MENDQPDDPADASGATRGLHFIVSPAEAHEVWPSRLTWLRGPDAPLESAEFELDHAPETLHLVTRVYEDICGIASISREPASFNPDLPDAWRLRGIATAPLLQGRGVGRIMVMTCMQHAWEQDGRLVWCNARTESAGFYTSLGFLTEGDEFDIPGVGPHVVMWRPLDAPRR